MELLTGVVARLVSGGQMSTRFRFGLELPDLNYKLLCLKWAMIVKMVTEPILVPCNCI